MSIQSKTYEICKFIGTSPKRAEVQALIHKLNVSDMVQGHPNYSTLGYAGRKQYGQFLGYLLVDQERSRFANAAFPQIIPPLDDNDRLLLLEMHYQITLLNDLCVDALV